MTPAEIAAQGAETRIRQGLPATVADPTTLAGLAAMVADTMILDRRGPEGRDPPTSNRPPEGGRRARNPAKETSTPNRTRAAVRGQGRTGVRRGGGGP
jgi:hypothetical protein